MPAQYKVEQVAELKQLFDGAEAVFVAEYRGLTVAQASALRKAIRDAGGKAKVARNRLAEIALDEVGLAKDVVMMKGPNIYVVAADNSPAVAKAIKTFAEDKANAKFVIKGGVMGKEILSVDGVKALATMPSRDELIAKAAEEPTGEFRLSQNLLPCSLTVKLLRATQDRILEECAAIILSKVIQFWAIC